MAIRKTHIRELNDTKSIRTKRISSHSLTNQQKLHRIKQHFNIVIDVKNNISQFLFDNIESFLYQNEKDNLRKQYQQFKNDELSAWELQQVYQDFFDKYDEAFKRYKKNHKFRLQKSIKKEYYKKDTKFNQKGDLKSFTINFKNTPLSNLINWLVYVPYDDLDKVLKRYKENATDKVINDTKAFNKYLRKIRKGNKWERIKKLVFAKQQFLIKKIRLIQTQSGAYRKAYKENPTVASVGSEVFIDHSNTQFKHFYKFKIAKKEILYLPLAYNQDFHNYFKNINLNANHYVSLNNKGQINIGLQETFIQTFEETISKEQVAGIDLNIKHNFCVINIDEDYIEYDYDREFFKKQINDLKAIDAIGYNQLSIENKRKLQKIVKRTESYFQYLVSEILDSLQNKAITEIVLEDLNLQKTGFKTFSEEFGVSYNRLVKILRLNQVKHWFKNQGNKRGIKVHFTSPCATSIECSVCHTIEKDNRRNQEEFKCIECGHTINADNQASFNIGNRIKLDVLRDRLHNYDEFGQCTPKIMSRDTIKRTIKSCYKQQSLLNGDPFEDCKGETNSNCVA